MTESLIQTTNNRTSCQTNYKIKSKDTTIKRKTKKNSLADVLEEEEDENENNTINT